MATSGDEEEEEKVRVGKFSYRGETKHYAVFTRGAIDSQADLLALLDLWERGGPTYLLETNQSEKRRDQIITKENADAILQQVFGVKKEPDKPKQRPRWSPFMSQKEKRHSEPIQALRKPPPAINTRVKSAPQRQLKNHLEPFNATERDESTDNTEMKEEKLAWLREYTGQGSGDTPDWTWINKYLHRKTVGVLKSLVSAADLVEGWLLCVGPPSSNEKMIEVALNATGAAPTVLVVDDLTYYKQFWDTTHMDLPQDSNDERACNHITSVIDSLLTKGMALEDALHKPDVYDNLHECIELVDFEDTLDLSYKRSSTLDPLQDESKRMKPSLWKYRPGSSETDYHRLGLSSEGRAEGKDQMEGILVGEWKAEFPWTRGTHFIFSEGYQDFNPRLLGAPSGFVCMHGGTDAKSSRTKRTGYIIRESMDQLRPALLFDNTGAETQMYARLIKAIKARDMRNSKKAPEETPTGWLLPYWGNATVDEDAILSQTKYYKQLQCDLRQEAAELLSEANKGNGMEGSRGLSVLNTGDVLEIVDRYCSNPRLFQKIVVPVDPLEDTPEQVVRVLAEGFQRAALESREVGAGDADIKAVVAAWRLHEQLGKTREIKRKLSTFLYFAFLLASFLTTFLAVLEGGAKKYAMLEELRWPATAVAVIASICVGAINLFDSDSKLKTIETAQAQIVYEIFRFRMRVGRYSLIAREIAEDLESLEGGLDQQTTRRGRSNMRSKRGRQEDAATLSANESKKMHSARARFSESIKGIISDLGSIDLHFKDDYSQRRHKDYCVNDPKHTLYKAENMHEFQSYVAKGQLHLTDPSERCMDIALSGLISPEDYFQIRLLPLLEWLEKHEDFIRIRMRSLQILNMFFNGFAVVLGAADWIKSIPIVVAFAALLFQLLKVNDYERRFVIASSAARELRALMGTWNALGPLDQQTHSAARHLVQTCEQIALQFGTNSTIQVDKSVIGMDSVAAEKVSQHKPSADLNV